MNNIHIVERIRPPQKNAYGKINGPAPRSKFTIVNVLEYFGCIYLDKCLLDEIIIYELLKDSGLFIQRFIDICTDIIFYNYVFGNLII